jgi:hypothetical protein
MPGRLLPERLEVRMFSAGKFGLRILEASF